MNAAMIAEIPGPRGLPLVGSLFDFLGNPLTFLDRCAREGDGSVARFKAANLTFYMVYDPALAGQVLASSGPGGDYIKAKNQRDFAPILDYGLPISEGEFWQQQRRLVQPAFNHRRIDSYAGIMTQYTSRSLSAWQSGEAVDIHNEMMQLAFAIVCKCLFDADVEREAGEVGQAVKVFLDTLATRIGQPLIPDWLPTPANRRFHRAIKTVNTVVERIIRERRSEGKDHGDLLGVLLAARGDDGSAMSDEQLRAEVKALFLAGNETTAIALSWAIYLLAQDPQVEAKLGAELDEVLGGRVPTTADLPGLRYLEMIIKEVQRVFPPVWVMGREAKHDTTIGSYPVPKGTQIFISQWVMHHDSRYFPEPEKFNPERWTKEMEDNLPKYAYDPFGGGPRVCIGSGFAWLEAKLVLAMIYQRFSFKLLPEPAVVPLASATLRPKQGIRAQIVAR